MTVHNPLAPGTTFHGRESIVGRVVALVLVFVVRPIVWLWSAIPFLPWPYGAFDRVISLWPSVRGVSREAVELPNCPAELLSPEQGGSTDSAILYLHGGAFLVGGINSHRRLVSRIVRDTGVPALVVDYRMLPKFSVSKGVADCLDGLDYLIDSGISPERVAIAGDSAGGFLSGHVALLAARRGSGVGSVCMISPLIDIDPSAKLTAPKGDPAFPRKAFTTFAKVIERGEGDPQTLADLRALVTASPEDLVALPPTLIQIGSSEILRHDAKRFVAAILAAGGDARLEIYEEQVHVFQAGADIIPEARRAIASITEHITDTLHVARPGQAA